MQSGDFKIQLAAHGVVLPDTKSYYQFKVHLHLDLGEQILDTRWVLGDDGMDGLKGI
jgi:hypothetical protein